MLLGISQRPKEDFEEHGKAAWIYYNAPYTYDSTIVPWAMTGDKAHKDSFCRYNCESEYILWQLMRKLFEDVR